MSMYPADTCTAYRMSVCARNTAPTAVGFPPVATASSKTWSSVRARHRLAAARPSTPTPTHGAEKRGEE